MPFEIQENRLRGIRFCPSPFADERPPGTEPELIVVHGISLPPGEFGGPHVEELFLGALDPAAHPYFAEIKGMEVSSHVFISRDGEVVQFVPFNRRAWHAGKSNWCGRERCNDFSIGIELEGTDEQPYTAKQYDLLADIIHALTRTYSALRYDAVTGHSDIAPGRKTDPGPCFDWTQLHALLDSQRG